MEIILWRHAEAEPGEPDHGRKLTAKGEKQARRMAEWLHNRLPDTAKIVSSPARQAQQTARALSDVSRRKLKTVDALAPGATAEDALNAITGTNFRGALVVVGHQPTLGRLASRLLTEHDADWHIRKGAVVWISLREVPGGTELALRAAMSPDLA